MVALAAVGRGFHLARQALHVLLAEEARPLPHHHGRAAEGLDHRTKLGLLVFMDPPYNENLAVPALTALQRAGWLAEGALISLKVMKSEAVTLPDGFAILDDRTYGKARLIILGC